MLLYTRPRGEPTRSPLQGPRGLGGGPDTNSTETTTLNHTHNHMRSRHFLMPCMPAMYLEPTLTDSAANSEPVHTEIQVSRSRTTRSGSSRQNQSNTSTTQPMLHDPCSVVCCVCVWTRTANVGKRCSPHHWQLCLLQVHTFSFVSKMNL